MRIIDSVNYKRKSPRLIHVKTKRHYNRPGLNSKKLNRKWWKSFIEWLTINIQLKSKMLLKKGTNPNGCYIGNFSHLILTLKNCYPFTFWKGFFRHTNFVRLKNSYQIICVFFCGSVHIKNGFCQVMFKNKFWVRHMWYIIEVEHYNSASSQIRLFKNAQILKIGGQFSHAVVGWTVADRAKQSSLQN